MPLTRFKLSSIGDGGITTAKLADGVLTNTEFSGEYIKVPVGTTAERPGTPTDGMLRFNTDFNKLEQYSSATSTWSAIDTPPSIISLSYPNSQTAVDPAGGETVTLTGTNFQSGAVVSVDGTDCTTSFVSSTSVTFTTPAKTAGDYDVVVTNSNGLTATLTSGLSFNGTPAFTSPAAGKIGDSLLPSTAISTITIVAAEPDSGTLAYSITSGSLPSGLSLNSSSGEITGTTPSPTSETTYPFTVTATDDENQTSTRNYNLVVIRPVYNYSITNSLINEKETNTYLSRTPSTASNRKTWTISFWFKSSNLAESGYFPRFFSAATAQGSQTEVAIRQDGFFRYEDRAATVVKSNVDTATRTYDTTGWSHVVVNSDISNGTQSARQRIYINGVLQTSFVTNIQHSDTSYDSYVNSTAEHRIGESASYSGNRFGGYIAEVHFIDGQSLPASTFGDTYNNIWVPKQVTGVTYGTNGFYLDFSNASNLGEDQSGNNNDWTANNYSAGNGQSTDTPTNNFPTMNANNAQTGGISIRQGGLRTTKSSARYLIGATCGRRPVEGGKYYFEVKLEGGTSSGGCAVGLGVAGAIPNPDTESDLNFSGGGFRFRLGQVSNGNSIINIETVQTEIPNSAFTDGQYAGIGLDLDNSKVELWKHDGTKVYSGDVSGTLGNDTMWIPAGGGESGGQTKTVVWNFGATAFNIGLPTGYSTWKSEEPTTTPLTEKQPKKYFGIVKWTGNNTDNRDIGGLSFQPDFFWGKRYDSSGSHWLVDSARGPSYGLHSDTTGAWNDSTVWKQFNSDGIRIGTHVIANASGGSYIGYAWKAGGAPTATNSAGAGNVPTSGSVMIDGVASTTALSGTIPVTKLTANTESGFSVATYVGNGASSASIDHGLGKKPELVIIKRWGATSDGWAVDFTNAGNRIVELHNGNAFASDAAFGEHTDTVMNLVSSTGARNTNGDNHVMYSFASIPGFSQVGKYTGTGDQGVRGRFVHLGFRPAFVIVKTDQSGQYWVIMDSTLNDGRSYTSKRIFPNDGGAGDSNAEFEFHANGFKFYNGAENIDGVTTYFYACADQPEKYSNANLVNV